MSKAKSLLKRINEDFKSLQGMASALPKSDRDSLDSIVKSFGGFEKSLTEEIQPVKDPKPVGQIDVNAATDSERLRI